MTEFKVGDKVRLARKYYQYFYTESIIGDTAKVIENLGDTTTVVRDKDGKELSWKTEDLEKVIGDKHMGRRTFRLLKDSLELKKGTLVQEACDDGDQRYIALDFENYVKFDDYDEYGINAYSMSRKAVEENSKWFEEVFNPAEAWFTAAEMAAFKKSTAKKKGKK